MKKTILIAACLVMWSAGAFAHGGRLNAEGCHNEKRTGGYHCHRGSSTPAAKPAKKANPAPAATAATSQPLVGVASVIDGDTLEIRGQKIRFHGIDAPESSQLCKDASGKNYRCGQQAALALADFIGKKNISCIGKDVDRYKRIIGVCSIDGTDINAWMVQQGHAMAYRQYSKDYVGLEETAKAQKVGIWAGSFDAPWDWRKSKRK